MKTCTKVSDEGGPFLGVGPKAIWLVYFKEILNLWRVQKMFFHIKEIREITFDFSKRKALILEMCAKIVLVVNGRGVVKLLDWSKSVTKNAAGVT